MKRNLLLAALVFSAMTVHAGEADAGFKTAGQTVAACKAMVDQFEHTQTTSTGELSESASKELKGLTDLCEEQVRDIYAAIRKMGNEYIVGGLGLFGGFELNTPMITRASGNISGIGGGAVFATYDSTKGAPGLRLVPLLGGTLGGSYVGTTPQLIEFQKGVIIFIGRGSKSINDFNGTYIGAGFETRSPGLSDLNARSSIAVSFYGNMHMLDTFAVVAMKSTNTGLGTGVGIKAFGVDMDTETGAGLSIMDIPRFYAKQITKATQGIFSSLMGL